MAHELDITDGIASFADSRTRTINGVEVTDAWHRLGTPVGHLMTTDQALDAAHLRGWNVRKEPLVAKVNIADDAEDGGEVWADLQVPDRHAVIRDNPISGQPEALGVVGNRWTPFQNEDTTDLLSQIVDEGGAHIETAGALRGGRDTFVTMKLPDSMEFRSPITGEIDVTELYINVLNNHTGEQPLRGLISPVRIVCANTQRMAENAARSMVSLRHTGNPQARLAEIRALLGLTFAYRDTFVEQCETLIARSVDNVVVLDVIEEVFGVNAANTEKQAEGRKETAGLVMANYLNSPTVAPFMGTAFGVYNAVTEYLDHKAPVAGQAKLSDEEAAIRRAQRTLQSVDLGTMKANAMSALLAL